MTRGSCAPMTRARITPSAHRQGMQRTLARPGSSSTTPVPVSTATARGTSHLDSVLEKGFNSRFKKTPGTSFLITNPFRCTYDIDLTYALAKECFKSRYKKLIVEDIGQRIYAWPPTPRGAKGRHPPLQHIVQELTGSRSKLVRGSPRGDMIHNGSSVRFMPSVFIKNQPFPDGDAFVAHIVEARLESSFPDARWFLIFCPHGNNETCPERCFLYWHQFGGPNPRLVISGSGQKKLLNDEEWSRDNYRQNIAVFHEEQRALSAMGLNAWKALSEE